MQMTARLIGSAALVSVVALSAMACGGFADRKICFFNADPGCTPDFEDPTTPNIRGPNPNYPDPNVWKSAPGRSRMDAAVSKAGLRINEVLVNLADGAALGQKLELLNDTSSEFDASGYAIRTPNGTFTFPEGSVIASGAFVVLHLAHAGDEAAAGDFLWLDSGRIDAEAGFIALVSPKGMVADYVQWGEALFDLATYAVAEGQWLEGTQCRPVIAGASLAFAGNGNLPTDFTAQWPTIGAPNK